MELYEFTSVPDPKDREKITQVRFVLADHAEPDERTEWINVQVSVELPTVLNGALLRSKALEKVRGTLDQLIRDYEHLGREYR